MDAKLIADRDTFILVATFHKLVEAECFSFLRAAYPLGLSSTGGSTDADAVISPPAEDL